MTRTSRRAPRENPQIRDFFNKHFFKQPKRSKRGPDDKELLDKLLTVPKKERGADASSFNVDFPDVYLQADLLFMPRDVYTIVQPSGTRVDTKEYLYILTVVDPFIGITDAEPMTSKTSAATAAAFKKIMSRKIISSKFKHIHTDPGTEFKGDFSKLLETLKKQHSYGKTARHRQSAFVESRNRIIGSALLRYQTQMELNTKVVNRDWVYNLPIVIELMNKRTKIKGKNKASSIREIAAEREVRGTGEVLKIGSLVHVILDVPRNVADMNHDGTREVNKLMGNFRDSDIRYEIKPRKIANMYLTPGKPPMYEIEGIEKTLYTKGQLLQA